jgi:hypothetical protein
MRKARIRLWLASACVCAGAIAIIPAIATGASGTPPAVTSAAATNVTSGGATLNGSVNPNGQAASYAFDWGTTTAYGHETPFTSAGSGTSATPVSAAIAHLTPGTTYHFRAIAKSSAGTTTGSDESFTTSAAKPNVPVPTASTGGASQLSDTSVRVNGSLDPKGQATTYFFQYGSTTAYGIQTRPVSAGAGTGNEAVHAVLSGLTPKATYHYRLVAEDAGGPAYGADHTVTVGPAQSHVAYMGHMGFVSPGGIIGVEAGCFGGATACQGHVTMTTVHGGVTLGQRNFYISPRSGGFQNIGINATGKRLLKQNRVWHLLQVNVKVTTTAGQHLSQTMTLARWVWPEAASPETSRRGSRLLGLSGRGRSHLRSVVRHRRIWLLVDQPPAASPQAQVAGGDPGPRGVDLAQEPGCPSTFFHALTLHCKVVACQTPAPPEHGCDAKRPPAIATRR